MGPHHGVVGAEPPPIPGAVAVGGFIKAKIPINVRLMAASPRTTWCICFWAANWSQSFPRNVLQEQDMEGGPFQNGHACHQLSSQRGSSPLMQAVLSCYGDSSLQLKPFLGAEETLLCFWYCQMLSDGGLYLMGVPDHFNHLELNPFRADCSNKTPLSILLHILH